MHKKTGQQRQQLSATGPLAASPPLQPRREHGVRGTCVSLPSFFPYTRPSCAARAYVRLHTHVNSINVRFSRMRVSRSTVARTLRSGCGKDKNKGGSDMDKSGRDVQNKK